MIPHFDLPPLKRAVGSITLPGSKSISNRALLLAALAAGETHLQNLLTADDTQVMLTALRQLGTQVDDLGQRRMRVSGAGGIFPVKDADLFLGNAGTALRSLTAVLALCGGCYQVRGVARMHERPIGDLVEGLRQIGADVRYAGKNGFPPLTIHPAEILLAEPLKVRGDVSSQFLSGLLLALPLIGKQAEIEVVGELISRPYVELTLNLMQRFGVVVKRSGWRRLVIPAGQRYRSPGTLFVEGDASAASYFLAAGAVGGGPVRVEGVGRDSIQGDLRMADALEQLGAKIERGENYLEASTAGLPLAAFDLDCNDFPDAAMTLAITALFADGPCVLRNIGSWRVKETDRIAAMATELRKFGVQVEEGADWLKVWPMVAVESENLLSTGLVSKNRGQSPTTFDANTTPSSPRWGERRKPATVLPSPLHPLPFTTSSPLPAIDTYGDHRMAMCFALVAFAGQAVRINDPGCVAKTFPGFFAEFERIIAPVVCIDGPSASGKGTVAQRVAQALGFHYLDSGALYRLTALAAQKQALAQADEAALAQLAANLPVEFAGAVIRLAGEDVTEAIRAEEIGVAASKIAALPAVRAALLERQRDDCRLPGLVADGRDMGAVVFPWAGVKIFLTASVAARAQRRYKQLIDKGLPANMRALLQDLEARDARDAQRSVAPLKQEADAVLLDTTELDIDESVAAALAIVRQRL